MPVGACSSRSSRRNFTAPSCRQRSTCFRSACSAQPGPAAGSCTTTVVELRLVHGSIVEANARALVLGVFRNVDPSGPAAAVDAVLGGAIREFTLRRMFAGQLGQVFVLPVSAQRADGRTRIVRRASATSMTSARTRSRSLRKTWSARSRMRACRGLRHRPVRRGFRRTRGDGRGAPAAGIPRRAARMRTPTTSSAASRFARSTGASTPLCAKAIRRLRRRTRGRRVPARGRRIEHGAAGNARQEACSVHAHCQVIVRTASPRPAYLLVTLGEQGKRDYACRTSLLTAGTKAAVLSGSMTLSRAELKRQLAPLENGTATSDDTGAASVPVSPGLLLAASVREGLESMQSRPLVVVHDREASRVPWEVLRIGSGTRRSVPGSVVATRARRSPWPGGAKSAAPAIACGCCWS